VKADGFTAIAEQAKAMADTGITADAAAPRGGSGSSGTSADPITALKTTVCKLFR
jgi:hypothetical protein